ncbi:MAG: phage integrase N-terminal SAM-like domain-containing protein [Pseudomonadota bacterium]|nr:phage integrase N-terminal SAM-like domain-containing protein [Pseudomonadota bacterium]
MGKSPFLERVCLQIRLRHYSIRTAQSYLHWVYRFIIFKKRHPHDMAEAEVSAFLAGWLSNARYTAAVFFQRPLTPAASGVKEKI